MQLWSGAERLMALDQLIERCDTAQVKHMMQVMEPQFQRDFISLLPKEVSLHLSSHPWMCPPSVHVAMRVRVLMYACVCCSLPCMC